MRLPGLPFQFWTETTFRNIREDFGHYLDHDRSYLTTCNRALAHIPIFLDTKDGLHDTYNMFFRGMIWQQTLDYEGVPFRCRKCHEVGHLFKDCTKLFFSVPLQNKTISAATQTEPIICSCMSLEGTSGNAPTTSIDIAREPPHSITTWPITQAQTHAQSAPHTIPHTSADLSSSQSPQQSDSSTSRHSYYLRSLTLPPSSYSLGIGPGAHCSTSKTRG